MKKVLNEQDQLKVIEKMKHKKRSGIDNSN